jgi:hypothetical protein
MESVFGIDSQATDLGAVHLQRAGDVSGLLAISVQTERYQIGGSQLNWVPFEDD